MMDGWHIHIEGQVQGVGFRPLVWKLAQQFQLAGWVNNAGDGVHIVFDAEFATAQAMYKNICEAPPPQARLLRHQLRRLPQPGRFRDFRIIQSDDQAAPRLLLTPDFGLCEQCRTELHDSDNRRYHYAFTTCTECGPRFSLMYALPYDRERTSMQPFRMCPECQEEYDDPEDRRFFSQTNSCPNCGVKLRLFSSAGTQLDCEQREILLLVQKAWQDGQIVAIKGIGGFLLTCAANNKAAIQLLRQRKARPTKPLAVMFPNLENARKVVALRPVEEQCLLSPEAPIVLSPVHPEGKQALPTFQNLAPCLTQLGVMLPYTPLFELLLAEFGQPIVATSGNVSGSPIIYREEEALRELSQIADWIVSDNRDIALPQDDSVVQFTPSQAQRLVLRRSRGLAPSMPVKGLHFGPKTILATGAQMKSTFAIWQNEQCDISPYLGDQDNYLSQEHYQASLQQLSKLLRAKPQLVLSDLHPDYAASVLGGRLAAAENLEHHLIQHHEAHFGAVLAEHQLLDTSEACLGVVWDGTGYGTDGQIWGGEFFRYQQYQFQRLTHWAYQPHLAGDKMAREPRLAALSFCNGIAQATPILKTKFNATEWRIYQQLLQRPQNLGSSSVGRLFDAVASLLGLGDIQQFEGEAAMRLEALASAYIRQHGLPPGPSYGLPIQDLSTPIPTSQLLGDLIADLQQQPLGLVAARFHLSLVQHIQSVAEVAGLTRIAFSGGVFQNALLVDLLQLVLPETYELHFHQQLSPNDENISFGQMACYYAQQQAATQQQNRQKYVLSNSR